MFFLFKFEPQRGLKDKTQKGPPLLIVGENPATFQKTLDNIFKG